MSKPVIRYLITIFAYLVVLYPLFVRATTIQWQSGSSALLLNVFPFLGLAAFSLLWLHSISGVFEPWLRKYINFDQYVHSTSIVILICIILHPLLLLTAIDFRFSLLLTEAAEDIWLGVIGLVLLLTYDIGKVLKRRAFFARNWDKILLISTVGFLLIFFHSLGLGDDLQAGPLRAVWVFYGATAILATIYTYGIKKLRV